MAQRVLQTISWKYLPFPAIQPISFTFLFTHSARGNLFRLGTVTAYVPLTGEPAAGLLPPYGLGIVGLRPNDACMDVLFSVSRNNSTFIIRYTPITATFIVVFEVRKKAAFQFYILSHVFWSPVGWKE